MGSHATDEHAVSESGIVVGIVVAAATIAVAGVLSLRRRKRGRFIKGVRTML